MTAKSIIVTTFLLVLVLSIFKILLIKFFDMTAWYTLAVFLFGTLILTTACVRRAGRVNNFEIMIGIIFWTVLIMVWDFTFLTLILGYDMYYHLYFWLGYVVMAFTIIAFSKRQPLKAEK